MAYQGLVIIQKLYEVERAIIGDPHEDRRQAHKLSKLRALVFFT